MPRYKRLPPLQPTGTPSDTLQRTADDGTVSFIPMHAENADYQDYLNWRAAGNDPEPADS